VLELVQESGAVDTKERSSAMSDQVMVHADRSSVG
jgi:hypothetical protein